MKVCQEHHFGSDGRCSICQMQARYYAEAMTTLNNWEKRDKENPSEHWQEIRLL